MTPNLIVNARFLESGERENNGILRYAREISMRLKAIDPSIQFLTSKKIKYNQYSKALKPISFGLYGGAVWEQFELPLYVRRKFKGHYLLNFDNISPVFYGKNISSVHDLNFKHVPYTFEKKARIFLSTIIPLVIKTSRKILTVSDYSKNDIIKQYGVKDDKIKVIYPGFSNNFNNNVKDATGRELSELSLTPQKYFLASMYKNPKRLIQAFKLMNRPDVKLVFFGHLFKKVFGHLIPEIESSENIVYLGKISDSLLAKLYSNALAFAFPSLHEGFGSPLLESMSSKCPIIASNLSSIPEVCQDAAVYVNPYDINDMADKMRTVSSNEELRQALIVKGTSRLSNFSYDKTVSELFAYFKSIGIYN